MQERLGVAEKMERLAPRMFRDHLPDQHRSFHAQLPFVLVGAVDGDGAPWATLVEGRPGFISSSDPRTLWIGGTPPHGDPAMGGLAAGSPVGLLGIDLETRRRNRVNGRVASVASDGFGVAVEQAFGNCPQHIRLRDLSSAGPTPGRLGGPIERRAGLDAEAREAISAADTFFVATFTEAEGIPPRRTVDVSHRGGRPGVVRVDGDVLTIPDFAGNMYFNTLGNILVTRRAGLLFVGFERGDLLQITGSAEVVLDGQEIAELEGAERLWRVRAERVVRRRGALSLRWKAGPLSPYSLETGTW